MHAHSKPFTSLTSCEIDFIDLISSLIQSRQIQASTTHSAETSFKWGLLKCGEKLKLSTNCTELCIQNGCFWWDRPMYPHIARILTTRPLRGSPPLGKAQGIINDLIFVIKPREDCQLKQAGGVDFFIQKKFEDTSGIGYVTNYRLYFCL